MIDKINYEECMLCKACSNVCPLGCIEFNHQIEASYYPKIDYDICIKCDKCERVCPILKVQNANEDKKKVLVVKNKENSIRMKSSSGGVFYSIANQFLINQGLVCGAILSEELEVKHRITNCEYEVKAMRGSKYVLSNIGDSLNKIKTALEIGKEVIFCGTPCQVAGLNSIIGRKYKNLLLVDFICHGVVSPEVFRYYIEYVEKKEKSKVVGIDFRNKKYGWGISSVKILFDDGKSKIEPWFLNAYMRGYLNNITLQKSCYSCKFKNFKSESDITLGDFWGAGEFTPKLDDDRGLSIVIFNTVKGKKYFENVESNFIRQEIDLQQATKYNQYLFKSANETVKRNIFFDKLRINTDKAFEILEPSLVQKIMLKSKYLFSKIKKRILKIDIR